MLIKNVNLIDWKQSSHSTYDILIEDGFIADISEELSVKDSEIIEGKGLTAFPGFIDVHVHLREPGYEYKETISSGTLAAAAGGVTTLCSMPNVIPCPDNLENYKKVNTLIKERSTVETFQAAAINKDLSGERTNWEELYKAGARIFTNDGLAVSDSGDMADFLAFTVGRNAFVSEHAEIRDLDSVFLGGEDIIIARDIMLNEKLKGKLHLAHVSMSSSMEILKEARKRGIPFTAETCPHYFTGLERTQPDSWYEVYPPIRTENDIEAIRWAIRSGIIDVLASDHAPHNKKEKFGLHPARGFSGVELLFLMGYNELVKSGLISIEKLIKLLVYSPSLLLGKEPVCFEKGKKADITLVDLKKERIINEASIYSRGKNTPFIGKKIEGEIIHTIASGKIIFSR